MITNNEWMTIAANAAAQGVNWEGGTVGTNEMARGHSDNSPGGTCAADADDNNAYIQSIGQYFAGSHGSGGIQRRGGHWGDQATAGIFTTTLNSASGDVATTFRCVVAVP